MKKFKTIGVLGGLGPEATLKLYEDILRKTKAKRDQDNIPMIIFNNPQIPDRSEFIINNGADPLPELIKSAQILEKAGAEFVVMPCNTAHYFMEKIRESISIPFIDMIDLTANYISDRFKQVKKVGLLITTGSLITGFYTDTLKSYGIEAIFPSKNSQKKVMKAIYKGVKAGKKDCAKKTFESVSKELIDKGAELIVMGCTEVPLALTQDIVPVPLINPIDILAEKTVKEAVIA